MGEADPMLFRTPGLTYDSQSRTEYLISVDPNTGMVTRVGHGLPGVARIYDGPAEATADGFFYFAGQGSSFNNYLGNVSLDVPTHKD
jgi:hypothetical protein